MCRNGERCLFQFEYIKVLAAPQFQCCHAIEFRWTVVVGNERQLCLTLRHVLPGMAIRIDDPSKQTEAISGWRLFASYCLSHSPPLQRCCNAWTDFYTYCGSIPDAQLWLMRSGCALEAYLGCTTHISLPPAFLFAPIWLEVRGGLS